MHPAPGPASPGAQPTDHPGWRLAFHLLHEHGPWWVTSWLILIIAGLVALAAAAPLALGAIAAVGTLTRGGKVLAKRLGGRTPEAPPDPALDPPP